MAVILLTLAIIAAMGVTSHGGIFNLNPSECTFYQPLYSTSSQLVPPAGFVWVSSLTGTTSNAHPCSRQGLLRVTPPATSTSMRIRYGIYDSTQWSFHVSDSNTGNGYGGDAGTSQGFSAEVHSIGKSLLMYNNVNKAMAPPVPGQSIADYFEVCPVVWEMNITKNNFPNTDHPTDLRMTTDPLVKGTRVDVISDQMFRYDELYLGINRVASGPGSRVGLGACELCVTFY